MAELDLVQCQSCGGIYPPVQKDGTEYYHACPGRRIVAMEPAPTKDQPDLLKAVYAPIDQPRNENIAGVDDDGKAVMVAEGKGIVDVVDKAVIAAFGTLQEAP